MTAVTGAPAAAQSGRPLSGGVREAAQIRTASSGFGTAARPVPAAGHQAPATGNQSGRTVAAAVPGQRSPVPVPGVWLRTLGATQSHVSQQLIAAALGGRRDTSDRSAPASATVVEDGPEWSAEAYVEGLDGAERKLLLNHIARAFPDVVEAGAELVARWRAECAEERRKRDRRREHDRRRRRRAEA